MYGPPPAPPRPPRNGKKIAFIAGGILVGLLAILWVIGTLAPPPEEKADPAAAPASTAPSSAQPAPQPAAPPPSQSPSPSPSTTKAAPPPAVAPEQVPEPTAAQQRTYLASIARIDPGLAVDRERAMRRAGRICERIVRPPGGTLSLEQYTVLELSGGNATIDQAQARQVIRAVRVWCR